MEEQRRGTGEEEQGKRRDLGMGGHKIILSRAQARLSAGLVTTPRHVETGVYLVLAYYLKFYSNLLSQREQPPA